MLYLTVAFLSFIFTVFLTQFVIRISESKNLFDNPNGEDRRVHSIPVPRLGGVVIFLVVMSVTFFFYPDIWSKKFLFLGAIIIFVLGVWDDLKPIKWYIKFLVQLVAGTLLIFALSAHEFTIITFADYAIPPILNYFLLLILIVGTINSFNLLDGLDGLVTGLALILSAMCFILSLGKSFIFLPIITAAITGTTLGFLKFNANPARIFLGDSGAFILGYLITGMLLVISSEAATVVSDSSQILQNKIDVAFIIIVLAVPLTDTLRVMYRRIKNKKNPFHPDKYHIHHLIYSRNIRHKTVVLLINTISVVFALLGLYYYTTSSKFVTLAFFLILFTLLLFAEKIMDLIIKSNTLLKIATVYKKLPLFSTLFYKRYVLPTVFVSIIFLMIYLLFTEAGSSNSIFIYFLLITLPALIYSIINFKKKNYYLEILVFINFIIFFVITGLNGFFYKLYRVPIISQININQIFIIVLFAVIIFFILFRERVIKFRGQFLNGADLSLALFIAFIYMLVQFVDVNEAYKISDTLLRSFLLFLFYKILITIYPRFHYPLHYASFGLAVLATMILLF